MASETEKLYKSIVFSCVFCSPVENDFFLVFLRLILVSCCSETVMVKMLEEELEEVNSGAWAAEEMVNFITH